MSEPGPGDYAPFDVMVTMQKEPERGVFVQVSVQGGPDVFAQRLKEAMMQAATFAQATYRDGKGRQSG